MVLALTNLKTLTKIIFTTMMFGNSKVMFSTIAQVIEGNGDDDGFNFFCQCRKHCIDFLFICPF